MKRKIALLLTILMLMPLAASCSESAQNGDETGSSQSTPVAADNVEEAVPDVETKMKDDVPADLDFGGADVRVAHREGERGQKEIYVEEDTGDALDSAIFARNMAVEERLGVKIVPTSLSRIQ